MGFAAVRNGCGALWGGSSGHNVRVLDAPPMLVGRASEEREIEARLSLAERGVGGLVVLVGEPGLGKTALAEHASVAARQRGFSVGWAACWQTAAVPPLQPWTELVGQLARPGVTSPDLAIPGGDRDSGRVEQAARVVEWLRERADAPLLLVVDDLHWADAATLSVLTQVASVLASMPIVVVAAHRPVDAAGALPRSESVAELQHHGLVLELRGLDVDGTTAAGLGRTGAARARRCGALGVGDHRRKPAVHQGAGSGATRVCFGPGHRCQRACHPRNPARPGRRSPFGPRRGLSGGPRCA